MSHMTMTPDPYRFSDAYDPPPADRPHPSEYEDDPMTTLVLTITVPNDNKDAVTDALNEVLNMLALDGVLDDGNDDAWAWSS